MELRKNCAQRDAAARAGFSERTARRLDRDGMSLKGKDRTWRTRNDPLAEVWESVLRPMLEETPSLMAVTLLEILSAIILSSKPGKHRAYFGISSGSNWPLRSRGISSTTRSSAMVTAFCE